MNVNHEPQCEDEKWYISDSFIGPGSGALKLEALRYYLEGI